MIYKAVTLYILGLIYNIFIRSIPSIPLHSIHSITFHYARKNMLSGTSIFSLFYDSDRNRFVPR